jgi:hypothetical protein
MMCGDGTETSRQLFMHCEVVSKFWLEVMQLPEFFFGTPPKCLFIPRAGVIKGLQENEKRVMVDLAGFNLSDLKGKE